jgi:hypothetical protein
MQLQTTGLQTCTDCLLQPSGELKSKVVYEGVEAEG